jgi:protein arginine N-methyltransferase 1
MSQSELSEHRGYLADERRLDAYRAALAEVVRVGDVVLDLGAGTGVLGLLACEAGARSVIAVERGDIIETTRRIAAANGYGDRIIHVKAVSSETTLPMPIDVAVCDQIGGLVHDAGILSAFADARRRFLRPGGHLVPSAFQIMAAPVQYDEARGEIEFWSTAPAGFDMTVIRAQAANTEWMINLTGEDLAALAPGAELTSFTSDHDVPITARAHFEVSEPGRFDGFVGWFVATMSPSVSLTNDPWSPNRFKRWCNFYPVDRAVAVEAGDQLTLAIDIRRGIVSWNVGVTTRHGHEETRQSTFLKSSDTDLLGSTVPVPWGPRVTMARSVLDLIDGQRTREGIVELMADHVGTSFVSRAHLENFVRQVTAVLR